MRTFDHFVLPIAGALQLARARIQSHGLAVLSQVRGTIRPQQLVVAGQDKCLTKVGTHNWLPVQTQSLRIGLASRLHTDAVGRTTRPCLLSPVAESCRAFCQVTTTHTAVES